MDIEKLNRTQIILLTLLTSFVTSIATGIVTVTLLDQAPPGVTQTINRIVERTVERAVPVQGAAVITKETTLVVKEEDLITKAIESNRASLVSVVDTSLNADGTEGSRVVSLGIVMTTDGVIATDSGSIADSGAYSIETFDGARIPVTILNQDEGLGIALLQASSTASKYAFTAAELGDVEKARLGQSVIVFGGKEERGVSLGIISSLTPLERKLEGTTTTERFIAYVESSVTPPGGVTGTAIVSITGQILGMNAGERTTRFLSEHFLREKIAALSASKTATKP